MAEDVRIIKNKRVIENAMILLLQRKEFSKITIQDICQEALVSRSTFYCRFVKHIGRRTRKEKAI